MEQNQQPQPPVFHQPQQQMPQQQMSQQMPQQAPQYQPRVTARPMMGFIEAIKTCLGKYADFKGRARRSEFWWFVLFLMIVYIAGSFVAGLLASAVAGVTGMDASLLAIVLMTVIMLAFLIPFLAVLTRRLHDTGRGGWWVALFAVIGLLYSGSYSYIMWPILDQMGTTDPFELASLITEAMMSSPMLGTVMSFSGMIFLVLAIILFVFTLLDSKWGVNKYGPSPKYQ